MWSPYYYYFYISRDFDLSESTQGESLALFLEEELGLVSNGSSGFEGRPEMPWLDLGLVHTSTRHSWASTPTLPELVNLIPVVGSKRSGNRKAYIAILSRIAQRLGWRLTEEEDDDGNEDVVLWPPTDGDKTTD